MARKVRRIGRDEIEVRGESLIVTTPVQGMEGWAVSRYRASVIRFDGLTWRVVSKSTGTDRLTRYELVRWDPSSEELTGPEIDYSPDDVALRDHALELGRRRSRGTLMLNLIRPLTGFLSARAKDRLETRYGIDPVASTTASVFIQFLVALGSLALAAIGQVVGAHIGIRVPVLLAIAAVALLDATVRWSRVLEEVRPAPGFYEWLISRRR
jgi:hypothetical protein